MSRLMGRAHRAHLAQVQGQCITAFFVSERSCVAPQSEFAELTWTMLIAQCCDSYGEPLDLADTDTRSEQWVSTSCFKRSRIRLSFTMAGMIILSLFQNRLSEEVAFGMRKAMAEACRGQRRRQSDALGDNLRTRMYAPDAKNVIG